MESINNISSEYDFINQRIPCLYSSVFTPSQIDQVVKFCTLTPLEPTSDIIKNGKKIPNNNLSRNSKVFNYNDSLKSFFKTLDNYIGISNKETYNFELNSYLEHRYMEYSTSKEGLNWHLDIGPGKYNKRKLSYSIFANNPSEYEGGDLEIILDHDKTFKVPKEKGNLVIFPSYLLHRVTPITKGVRKVIVGFIGGKPFK